MNPAPSKYSVYCLYFLKNLKNNGITKYLKKIENKEGAR